MARRRSGITAVVVEFQRQQQAQRREQAAAQRAAEAAHRRHQQMRERAYREAQREAERGRRTALADYQRAREADAAARTAALETRVHELTSVLRTGLGISAFSWRQLAPPVQIPPFDPGPLGQPLAMPDQRNYHVPAPTGVHALSPAARRQYEAAVTQARTRFEHDWYQAQVAEAERQRRLAEYYQQFQAWAAEQQHAAADQEAQAWDLWQRVGAAEPGAVRDYFSAALSASGQWPAGFPWHLALAFDPAARQLVISWELPSINVVPAAARIRYFKTNDRESEITRPSTERRALHRDLLAQSALRVLSTLARADEHRVLQSIAFNGFVRAVNPATGQEDDTWVVAVTCQREELLALALDRVEAVSCIEGLRGQVSARPDRPEAVRPGRLPQNVVGEVSDFDADQQEELDLLQIDPLAFEQLLAELFRRRGLQVTTTQRSGDQGVDVLAVDPDPVTGGQIVIQAKRYRNTVGPDAVRDLWGTVDHHRAAKGILVTTSGFGPGSREFAHGKRLTLIDGPELTKLLREAGLPGRVGPG